MDIAEIDACPNLVTLFFRCADKKGDAPFLWQKLCGVWISISWTEAARQVIALADSLRELGLQPGDRVLLVSENRPEWCIADLAIMAAGCITVPAYVTNTERDHSHVLDDSGARAAIVSTARLARQLLPAMYRSQTAEMLIGMEDLRIDQSTGVDLFSWSALVSHDRGRPALIDERMQRISRDDLACIIYTSGTGGAPRGVRQHHGAILHNVAGAADILYAAYGRETEIFLSFLPLSHAYEHTGGQFLPIGLGAEIYYAEGLDKLAANIAEVRPTLMIVVPRLFEVLRTRILKALTAQGPTATRLLELAMRVGARDLAGKGQLLDWPARMLLSRTLIPKVRARFGGRLKAMVSGGAPLNPEIGLFFHSLGVTLLQGYGQTEAAPVISCNRPGRSLAMHSVGPPLRKVEVRIADDGEILVRGEMVMHGYWNNDAETARTIVDGWLHTGDVGHLDGAGRIVITDRKKDIIVNDKGDNISPQKLEGMLTLQPEISQAMVYGDRRPYLVALIVPHVEWALEWTAAEDIPFDLKELQDNPQFRAAVRAGIERVNDDVTVTEKIRQFVFADEPFAIENDEMTPSMKIRRHAIRARYQGRLESLYKDGRP